MQSELIYLLNSKLYFLEESGSNFMIRLPKNGIKYIKDMEAIGMPFNIKTNGLLKKVSSFDHPIKYTSEFRTLMGPILLGPMVYYLREANIEFTIDKRSENITQNLGFTVGESTNIKLDLEIGKLKGPDITLGKAITPCQFYLIKEKI